MKNSIDTIRDRFDAFNSEDESGMEAAQVILILFIVVIGLIPIVIGLKNAIADKGEESTDIIGDDGTYEG